MTRRWKRPGLVLASALLLVTPAHAEWSLAPEDSRVTATVVELGPEGPTAHDHQVRRLTGSADEDGTLTLPLRLGQSDVVERLGPLPPWLEALAERPLATLTTRLPPHRLKSLEVGDSRVEQLMLSVNAAGQVRENPLAVRFTRLADDRIRLTNAERIALDGQELMADPTAGSILRLLGYADIGDEVPVRLEALLVRH
jgi:hypothetical protein